MPTTEIMTTLKLWQQNYTINKNYGNIEIIATTEIVARTEIMPTLELWQHVLKQ